MSVALVCCAAAPVCCNAGRPSECFPLLVADGDPESQVTSNPEVKTLVDWLKSVPVDQDTISKVNSLLLLLCCLLSSHSLMCRTHVLTAPE